MKNPRPDKNGNYVFRSSILKTIPLAALTLFSLIIILFSSFTLITGNYTDLRNVVFRIVMCAVIAGISAYMIIKRPIYIISAEKVLLYGKWEISYSEIEHVVLHDNIIGMLEIVGSSGSFSIFAVDISCPLKTFTEILTERISVYEQQNA